MRPKPYRHLAELFGLAALIIVLVFTLKWLRPGTSLPEGGYPPPATPLAMAATNSPYPPPEQVVRAPASPAPTITYGPPPGLPTDLPWPPPTQGPLPTETPVVFPTPDFPPGPEGDLPEQPQMLWFPYYPDSGHGPQLRAVQLDDLGRRWAQTAVEIDGLVIPTIRRGLGGYPYLQNLHLSPDQRWIIADVSFWQPQVIDLLSGTSQPLAADSLVAHCRFLAWSFDSRSVLVFAEGLQRIDLLSGETEAITLDLPEDESPSIGAMAYSPDSVSLAYALIYQPVYKGRSAPLLEIWLRKGEGEGDVIVQVPSAGSIIEHSLRWSPDSSKLIFLTDVDGDDQGLQLWMVNVTSGEARVLMQLTTGVGFTYPASWSPDSQHIAAIRVEDNTSTNIYLFDIEENDESQVTSFANRRLAHVHWSPDGQWLAFTMHKGDYGEIWLTSLDGVEQYPVAGPTLPDAPFVWLPQEAGR